MSSAPRLTPSSLNWTPTTPTLSVAFADTVIVPETVAPADGAVMETIGGGGSFANGTLTAPAVGGVPPASPAPAGGGWAPVPAVGGGPGTAERAAKTLAPGVAPPRFDLTPTPPPV